MSETTFCYHCSGHQSIEEMRQILTKGGKRWRCIKSIEAAEAGIDARKAFGPRMTEANKAETQAKQSRMANPELDSHNRSYRREYAQRYSGERID